MSKCGRKGPGTSTAGCAGCDGEPDSASKVVLFYNFDHYLAMLLLQSLPTAAPMAHCTCSCSSRGGLAGARPLCERPRPACNNH